MTSPDEIQKFHQIRLQLSSEGLLELYTWLHDTSTINRCDAVELLRSTILATVLANLDSCKTPYVAVDDLIIGVTQDRLEQMAFGDDALGLVDKTAESPADYLNNPGPYKQQGPEAFSDPILDKDPETSWDNEGGRPINPDVLSAAAMQDDEEENEENAAETAELDESDTRALLDELKKGY